MQETRRRWEFGPWVGKIPWRRMWQPTPIFLAEKSHGQGSLAGYSPWSHKESDTTEWLSTYIVADAIIYFSWPFPVQVVVDFAFSFLHKRDGGKQESPTSLLLALISKKHKVMKRFEVWPELGGGGWWGGDFEEPPHLQSFPWDPLKSLLSEPSSSLCRVLVPSHELILTAFYN